MQQWKEQYEELKTALCQCRRDQPSFIKMVECCFHKAERHWRILADQVASVEFSTMEEEIRFFKEFKPLFTSEIEYYNMVYHSEVFKPVEDPVNELRYWQRELNKLDLFTVANSEFYIYYKAGQTYNDKDWFVRANNDLSNFPNARVYDQDVNATSSHDPLISLLLALERYYNYIQEKLDVLKKSDLKLK